MRAILGGRRAHIDGISSHMPSSCASYFFPTSVPSVEHFNPCHQDHTMKDINIPKTHLSTGRKPYARFWSSFTAWQQVSVANPEITRISRCNQSLDNLPNVELLRHNVQIGCERDVGSLWDSAWLSFVSAHSPVGHQH